MRKKECVKLLNEMLVILQDHECFAAMCDQLGLEEQELEIVLNSCIIDIENESCS